jgi:hypothetical protein
MTGREGKRDVHVEERTMSEASMVPSAHAAK